MQLQCFAAWQGPKKRSDSILHATCSSYAPQTEYHHPKLMQGQPALLLANRRGVAGSLTRQTGRAKRSRVRMIEAESNCDVLDEVGVRHGDAGPEALPEQHEAADLLHQLLLLLSAPAGTRCERELAPSNARC